MHYTTLHYTTLRTYLLAEPLGSRPLNEGKGTRAHRDARCARSVHASRAGKGRPRPKISRRRTCPRNKRVST